MKHLNKTYLRGAAFFILMCGALNISGYSQMHFQRIVIDKNCPEDPFGKSIGDIDGDKFTDLVVGGYTGGGIVWYKNPGIPAAHWNKYLIDEGPGFTTDNEAADIDQDGKLDLVVLNTGFIAWYRNDGTPANGKWARTLIEKRELHDIEINDFDGDGDIDIIGRNQSEWGNNGNVLHFYEQKDPTQWIHTTRSCPHGEGLTMVDLDDDGRIDIVTGNKWYKNSGIMQGSTWIEYTMTRSWTHPNVFVGYGDINGDDRVDLVLSPSERVYNQYHISWFEHPSGPEEEWKEHILEDSVQCDYHFIGCGDFDQDGKTDIVTAEMHHGKDPDEVVIYRNNGQGISWTKNILWGGGSHSCRIFDCDNDGDLDFFGANYVGTEVNLWVNQLIKPEPLSLDKWSYILVDSTRDQKEMGLAMADLNNDGFKDIASGKWVYFNPGGDMTGKWKKQTLPVNADLLLQINVDNDENADLIAEDGSGYVYWFEMNDRAGENWYYRKIGNAGKGNHMLSTQGYALTQLESGGKPEIIIVGGEQPEGAIYYFKIPSKPESDEWPRTVVNPAVYPEGVGYADFDHDWDIDLCATSEVNTKISWYENPGDGSGDWNAHFVGYLNGADRFVTGDMDGDGGMDIIATGANGTENGIYWFNTPEDPRTGKWIWHTIINTGKENSMNSLDIADMDQDGDMDLISGTHMGQLNISIWENDGKGHFIEHIVDTGKESHLGSRVADLDGDGDLDIVSIAWIKSQYLHVWRNDAIQ